MRYKESMGFSKNTKKSGTLIMGNRGLVLVPALSTMGSHDFAELILWGSRRLLCG
jgi:hypothetical protein